MCCFFFFFFFFFMVAVVLVISIIIEASYFLFILKIKQFHPSASENPQSNKTGRTCFASPPGTFSTNTFPGQECKEMEKMQENMPPLSKKTQPCQHKVIVAAVSL